MKNRHKQSSDEASIPILNSSLSHAIDRVLNVLGINTQTARNVTAREITGS
ncbi:MAG TPA: hypothetical protein V6C85_05405 [Allocoleopsis sp.]